MPGWKVGMFHLAGETWWLKASRQSRVLNEITTWEIYVGGKILVNEMVKFKGIFAYREKIEERNYLNEHDRK